MDNLKQHKKSSRERTDIFYSSNKDEMSNTFTVIISILIIAIVFILLLFGKSFVK